MKNFLNCCILLLSLLFVNACNDDEINRIKERLEDVEHKLASLSELAEQLSYAIDRGLIIEKIELSNADEPTWLFTFDDGTTIEVDHPRTEKARPMFRIDISGYWLWSMDNGTTYSYITDNDENRFCNIGEEAVDLKLSETTDNRLLLNIYTKDAPGNNLCTIETPFAYDGNAIIRSVVTDEMRHRMTIELRDGQTYVFAQAYQSPTGIAVLAARTIDLSYGCRTSVEFRINPSTASIDLSSGADRLELDMVGQLTRGSYVSPSKQVSLIGVEQVFDPETLQPKQGQYRAVIEDSGLNEEYDELLALVLTCQCGTSSEYQVSSSAFEVRSASLEYVMTGMPIVVLNTPNAQPISSRMVWADGANMTVLSAEGEIEYKGTLSIKGRGNTSWGFPKKPYALKLDQKASLLGMPEHRRWCLLANWADRSLIRNAVAFELARQTAQDWTPSGRHVELILNGQHLGNYYLCERVGIDENRLDIADPKEPEVDRGYLLELDTYFDEEYKFRSPVKGLPYQFKDPSVVTPEQQDFIEHYVAEMEDALYDSARFAARDFAELMDLESFADYWLIYEIAQLWEPNHPKSVFMHKDAGGKMKAGPVWDFDMGCFKPRPSYFFVNKNAFYYQQLFRDREFCLLLRSRLDAYRDKFLSVGNYIDELGERLYPSQCINYPMWPIKIDSSGDETIDDYSEVIARIRQAIVEKIDWLDENL